MKSREERVWLRASEFDLRRTLESGQIFHAQPDGNGWQILVDRTLLRVEQRGPELGVEAGRQELVRNYFALDHPLRAVYAKFPTDAFSRAALAACRGLRIIRQPKWECLATFIFSPMKQVAHIRQISLQLRARYGDQVEGSQVNAFPSAARLAQTTESDLRVCQLGFRAKNLLGTAKAVAAGELDLEALASESTGVVRDQLCRLPGVGRKVANCVLLFAYERLDVIPVDIWIARVLRAMHKRTTSLKELEEFSNRQFGSYAGYVQQYLFHHARVSKTLPA
ncbi:MAG TPA: DNA glycosylase [Terrimicrobiaceae bacterium]|nr:DNA glycosylase [Terrimicrobiaceae bacterium]